MRRVTATLSFAIALASIAPCGADAATVDTYDFSVGDWSLLLNGSPENEVLTGSFTGVVEPSGLIELADLTSFSATYAASSWGLADLSLFSFDTNEGASSLDVEAGAQPHVFGVCVGAAASLAANCTTNFLNLPPIGTSASYVANEIPVEVSSAQPTITLESSINTPIPGTLSLIVPGLLAFALFEWHRRRDAQALGA